MKTDSRLQKDAMGELAWQPSIHATQLGVEVRDGVVALAGDVATYAEKWNTDLATQRVAGVSGGDVTLSGSIHSWAERDLATQSAWNSPGVSKVIDNMTLSS